jgi:hypothetical protein
VWDHPNNVFKAANIFLLICRLQIFERGHEARIPFPAGSISRCSFARQPHTLVNWDVK